MTKKHDGQKILLRPHFFCPLIFLPLAGHGKQELGRLRSNSILLANYLLNDSQEKSPKATQNMAK